MMITIQKYIALTAGLVVAVQVGIILVTGDAACPTKACKVVEELTRLSPLEINLLGLGYFLLLFGVLHGYGLGSGRSKGLDWPGLLLLAGLAAEAVLFGFQFFVVRTFCLYCLLILAAIVLLNLLHGKKQTVFGTIVAGAILTGFSLLNFESVASSTNFTLEKGIFGSRTCTDPTKELYLIFSDDCPHCLEVIKALEACNSCDLHLNPINEVADLQFEGIEIRDRYSPQINRQILSIMGIDKIPVLLVEHEDGFQFIQGEHRIIDYVRHACFQSEETLYLNRSRFPEKDQVSAYSEGEGECSVTVDCEEPGTSTIAN